MKIPNLFLLSLLTFLAAIFSLLIPFAGYVGWALMPVPVTLLVLAERKRDAVICAILGLFVFLFIDYVLFLFLAAMALGVAFLYWWLKAKQALPSRAIGFICLVFIGSFLMYVGLVAAINGINFFSEFLDNYNQYVNNLSEDPVIASYGNLIAQGQDLEQVIDQTQKVLLFIPNIIAGMWIAFVVFASVINYAVSTVVLGKFRIDLKKLPRFGQWDLPWHLVWGLIAGIVLLVVPSFLNIDGRLLYIIGANLLIVFGFLYLIIGISVLWGTFEKYKLQFAWRIAILLLLGLFVGFMVLLPIVGLVDVWVNIRKLKR
ncbi:MAG: DUF2232 domain-containing protein [Actinomycetota bacterium]|nr:DUF2232 domain-containing protein [Actinomycetota bacterium]